IALASRLVSEPAHNVSRLGGLRLRQLLLEGGEDLLEYRLEILAPDTEGQTVDLRRDHPMIRGVHLDDVSSTDVLTLRHHGLHDRDLNPSFRVRPQLLICFPRQSSTVVSPWP